MVNNRYIAKEFQKLAAYMELHNENIYKIRSYNNTYLQVRKLDKPLTQMDPKSWDTINGIGKNTAAKIAEIIDTGSTHALQKLLDKTPPEVQELMEVSGIGTKKVQLIWKEIGPKSISELLYDINENKLLKIKGFSIKTQNDFKKKLLFYQNSLGKILLYRAISIANRTLQKLRNTPEILQAEWAGQIRRQCNIVNRIEIIIKVNTAINWSKFDFEIKSQSTEKITVNNKNNAIIDIHISNEKDFNLRWFEITGNKDLVNLVKAKLKNLEPKNEHEIFEEIGIPYLHPALRDSKKWWTTNTNEVLSQESIIQPEDIKGIIHSHSTHSDGVHTIEEMALAAKEKGYKYLVISDHSQAAFYANGLKPDRVLQQMQEIEQLNQKFTPFKIFKSTECDILNNGDLDFDLELLQKFDIVIASVHSQLNMDKDKATNRILKAVQHPEVDILGHLTGRLLLAREGYPVDHEVILHACKENQVSIELNANPHRLDIDWTWLKLAIDIGVKISINPDAHSIDGIDHVIYGVYSAQKAMLQPKDCLNTMSLSEFETWIKRK